MMVYVTFNKKMFSSAYKAHTKESPAETIYRDSVVVPPIFH